VSQSSEFCRHKPLCYFSTSNTEGKRIFRYRLSPETFGYTHVRTIKAEQSSHLTCTSSPGMKCDWKTFVLSSNSTMPKKRYVSSDNARRLIIVEKVTPIANKQCVTRCRSITDNDNFTDELTEKEHICDSCIGWPRMWFWKHRYRRRQGLWSFPNASIFLVRVLSYRRVTRLAELLVTTFSLLEAYTNTEFIWRDWRISW
jgi:hypothetical protein